MSYGDAKTILKKKKPKKKKRLQDRVATTSRRWNRREQHPPARQTTSLDWELDSQLLSHHHRLNIFLSDESPCDTGLQTPNHFLQPCPPLTLWDARHGPVQCVPTRSSGGRYHVEWRSSPDGRFHSPTVTWRRSLDLLGIMSVDDGHLIVGFHVIVGRRTVLAWAYPTPDRRPTVQVWVSKWRLSNVRLIFLINTSQNT